MARPLHEIARDIRRDWKNVYFGAKPYLEAMSVLETIRDSYGSDSARSIVLHFLSNASTWRGPVANEIKKELNEMAGVRGASDEETLRTGLVHLAASYPKGSPQRRRLLAVLNPKFAENFDPNQIAEIVPGPEGVPGSDAEKDWADGEFTQQEKHELGEKQEAGELSDGEPDDEPMKVASEKKLRADLIRLAQAKPGLRKHLLPLLKDAGCEKLPEGGMRENCEKKQEEAGKDDKKDEEKKAASKKTAGVVMTRTLVAAVRVRRTTDGVMGTMVIDLKNKSGAIEQDAILVKFKAVLSEDDKVILFETVPPGTGVGVEAMTRLYEEILQEALNTGAQQAVRIARNVKIAVYGVPTPKGMSGRMVMDLQNKGGEGARAFTVKYDAGIDGDIVSYFNTVPAASGTGAAAMSRLFQEVLQEALGTGKL